MMQQPGSGAPALDPAVLQMYASMGFAMPPELLQAAQQQQAQRQHEEAKRKEQQPPAMPSAGLTLGPDGLPVTTTAAAPQASTSAGSVRYEIGADGMPRAVPNAPASQHLGAAPLEEAQIA